MALNSYEYHYLFMGVFLLVAVVFPLLPILLARVIAPKKPSTVKLATYECGIEAKSESWVQFKVQYYIFALMFVIFDIEVVFIYPWAVAYRQLGLFAFVEMLVFLLILFFGLIYAWKKNVLEWK